MISHENLRKTYINFAPNQ